MSAKTTHRDHESNARIFPISKRMMELREGRHGPLTLAQKAVVSAFMNTTMTKRTHKKLTKDDQAVREKNIAAQKKYDAAFAASIDYEKAKEEMSSAITKGARATWQRKLREAELKITPAATQAAINDHADMIVEALKYFRIEGEPNNYKEFADTLREAALVARSTGNIKRKLRSARAVRSVIKKTFNLKGKPGRKTSR